MTTITLDSLEQAEHAFQLLKPIEQLHAWIKDPEGKFIVTNNLFSERFGYASAAELVGKTDHDLAPAHLANRYIEDDQRVLEGAIITDRLELIFCNNNNANWFRTSKWPIYNQQGSIIGTYGTSTPLSPPSHQGSAIREIATPIEYIQENFSDTISIEKLAEACHVSVSTLERRFKKYLSKTPQQYLMEVRLDNAKVMIYETGKSLSNIAQETGFVDNSHFTRAYKKRFKLSPSEDRKNRDRGDQ